VKFILVIIKRRHDIIAPSIVVENIQSTIGDFRDLVTECADGFVARELEGHVGDVDVGRSVLCRISYSREDMVAYRRQTTSVNCIVTSADLSLRIRV
jgi:hypothetical protein